MSHVPATKTRYVARDEVVVSLRQLAVAPRWIVATSARVAPYVADCVEYLRGDVRVASVGPATTQSLSREGVDVDIEGRAGAAELADLLDAGLVVHLSASDPRSELDERLAIRGIALQRIVCYEVRPRKLGHDELLRIANARVVEIGAPSAWNVVGDFVAGSTWVVVPGATTARVVARHHSRVILGWDPGSWERLRRYVGVGELSQRDQ